MRNRKDRTSIVQYNTKPVPEPPIKSIGAGLIYLAASFFNNTQSLDIEHADRDSVFAIRYRGYGYRPRKRRRHR